MNTNKIWFHKSPLVNEWLTHWSFSAILPFYFSWLVQDYPGVDYDMRIKVNPNKNAFQCHAYRPLVDHIPACTGRGRCGSRECVSQHALGRGVSAQGGVPAQGYVPAWGEYLPRGAVPAQACVPARRVPARGVYLPRGCVCLGVCVSQHAMGQTLTPVDRQTPVKT